jgi:hypothetical protein
MDGGVHEARPARVRSKCVSVSELVDAPRSCCSSEAQVHGSSPVASGLLLPSTRSRADRVAGGRRSGRRAPSPGAARAARRDRVAAALRGQAGQYGPSAPTALRRAIGDYQAEFAAVRRLLADRSRDQRDPHRLGDRGLRADARRTAARRPAVRAASVRTTADPAPSFPGNGSILGACSTRARSGHYRRSRTRRVALEDDPVARMGVHAGMPARARVTRSTRRVTAVIGGSTWSASKPLVSWRR